MNVAADGCAMTLKSTYYKVSGANFLPNRGGGSDICAGV